ncbi:MAG: hypothetical protein POELPBGB_00001 [Bacteroidia bacterium]|nr:hypothetical protein [Bacteroidia bacterium]
MVKIPPIANLPTVTCNIKTTVQILRRLKELVSHFDKTNHLDDSFIFPYSTDKTEKRKQIWDNLQKGLLFEDERLLIPWLTPFNQLDNIKEKRHDSGDRTLWYLGKRTILDGYEGHFEVIKWTWLPWTNPMTVISENIGHDFEGMKKFHYLNDYITNLLGDPTKIDLEKFASYDIGIIQWQNDLVKLTLVGIEHFNFRYNFSIGLVKDKNEEYNNKTIVDLKTSEMTDEELGK